jgi:hypothetical protein
MRQKRHNRNGLQNYLDSIAKHEPQNLTTDPLLKPRREDGKNAVTEAELLKMPPVATQIKNAAVALVKVTSTVTSGNPIVAPEEEIEKRKTICESCEFLNGHRCAKCGCVFNYKIRLATQRCPVGRWLPVSPRANGLCP